MKFITVLVLIFSQFVAFSQTKEDFLTCFELIMEHDDFQPAFENRGITGESLIIVVNNNRRANQNEFDQMRHSLRTDDFYDFSERVKVIQGDDKAIRSQGYDPMHLLQFAFSGKQDVISFTLSTAVENQNLMYNWNYKFVKEGEEWVLAGQNVLKSKLR